MASKSSFVGYVTDQMVDGGTITARKMFGEYGIYCDGKIVALICDNQLFVKPTTAGRAYCGSIEEAPPYPGAKPYLLISGDILDDSEWLSRLVRVTADELPVMKKKKKVR